MVPSYYGQIARHCLFLSVSLISIFSCLVNTMKAWVSKKADFVYACIHVYLLVCVLLDRHEETTLVKWKRSSRREMHHKTHLRRDIYSKYPLILDIDLQVKQINRVSSFPMEKARERCRELHNGNFVCQGMQATQLGPPIPETMENTHTHTLTLSILYLRHNALSVES